VDAAEHERSGGAHYATMGMGQTSMSMGYKSISSALAATGKSSSTLCVLNYSGNEIREK
jgi:hypothetical protein